MPVALPNVYCTPQDLYEYLGADAAQLRLDDRSRASAQSVIATATADIAATSISVQALQYPMLAGTVLVFDAAAMSNPVEATLSAPASAGATNLQVQALGAQVSSGAVAVDNGVNVWTGGLLLEACKRGTARVKLYCCGAYDDSELDKSWSVNQWAIVMAAYWLTSRRLGAPTGQLKESYDEAMQELREVRDGTMRIEDIGTRTSDYPAFSNVTVDQAYTYRKIRVEQSISEQTVTQYPQAPDWNSMFFLEW